MGNIIRTLLFILTIITSITGCDLRTSSKDRLESVSDIILPTDLEVIKDEYQDMGQDYCIEYVIRIKKNFIKSLEKQITSSKYFENETRNKVVVWKKSENGYQFHRQENQTTHFVEFNILDGKLKYSACAD